MKNQNRVLNRAAFTLTELLIVMALLAIIGTFVFNNVIGRFNEGKVNATKILMKQLATQLDDFRRVCGFYPLEQQGLEALTAKPTVGRDCKNYPADPFVKKVPKDGFDNDFLYTSDGNKYVVRSLGQDGAEGGEGVNKDISSEELE